MVDGMSQNGHAAFPLVTLKSLLENPAIPSNYYRKLLSSGGSSVFSMNNKKAGDLSGLSHHQHSHSPGGGLGGNSPAAAAAVASGWGVGVDQFESAAAQAFLGPSIWDKSSPYESMGPVGGGHDFKLEYMDLDEFLSENGLGGGQSSSGAPHGVGVASPHSHDSACSSPSQTHMPGGPGEDNKVSSTTGSKERDGSPGGRAARSFVENSVSFGQSDLAGVTHLLTKDALHIGPDMNGEFAISPADIALATVPGSTVNFDPRRRRFSEEELKPQPMVKKSKKQFVPDDMKDEKYWARRRKNNLAAKRSRDARRVKENQIAIRAAYLEKENAKLREQLDKLTRENMLLRDKLKNDLKAGAQ